MKIAIFSDNFYPELSGISDAVLKLGQSLRDRGHEIRYYVPGYSGANYRKVGKPQTELDLGPGISIKRIFSLPLPSSPSGQGRLVLPSGLQAWDVKRWGADVIHTQMPGGVGLEALIVSRMLGLPLVGTNHTAMSEFLKHWPVQWQWLHRWVLKRYNWYYEKCIIISAPSRSVFDDMAEHNFRGKGIVISNPLDLLTFRPLPDKAALTKEFEFTPHTLIYAGRLAPEKEIQFILHAMPKVKAEFPDALFVLVGSGPDLKRLQNLTAELKLSDSVRFLGFRTQEDLCRILNAAQMFVIMSPSETQSLTTMQAMSCGLPVIGADERALKEYIQPAHGRKVARGDWEALALEIITLFRDPDLAKKMGTNGLALVQTLAAPKIAERWERIYAEAMKDHAHSKH